MTAHVFFRRARAVLRDSHGLAAVEFAFIAPVLIYAMLNVIELAVYMHRKMAVENAAQMGAQAAWQTCDTIHLPATTQCADLSAALTQAIQSTSLKSDIRLTEGSPSEGYYCLDASNKLVKVGTTTSRPMDCSSVGRSNTLPADYVTVSVSYTYTPLLGDAAIGGAFATPIVASAMMRLQ